MQANQTYIIFKLDLFLQAGVQPHTLSGFSLSDVGMMSAEQPWPPKTSTRPHWTSLWSHLCRLPGCWALYRKRSLHDSSGELSFKNVQWYKFRQWCQDLTFFSQAIWQWAWLLYVTEQCFFLSSTVWQYQTGQQGGTASSCYSEASKGLTLSYKLMYHGTCLLHWSHLLLWSTHCIVVFVLCAVLGEEGYLWSAAEELDRVISGQLCWDYGHCQACCFDWASNCSTICCEGLGCKDELALCPSAHQRHSW